MLALLDHAEPVVADAGEAAMATKAAAGLKPVADAGQAIQLAVHEDNKVVATLPVPARAVQLLLGLLEAMAKQVPVSIIPHEAELTTQQAADFLNVSRPFLVKQIAEKRIPFRMVGSHKRIRFADLRAYEMEANKTARQALAEMAAEAKQLRLD